MLEGRQNPRSFFAQTIEGCQAAQHIRNVMPRNYFDLLKTNLTDDIDARAVFEPIGFGDWEKARERLVGLAKDGRCRDALAECMPMLLSVLSNVAAPDSSLLNFERFVQSVSDPLSLLLFLRDNPRAVEVLIKLFTGSQFLTDILLRNPGYLRQLTEHKRLAEFKAREEFVDEALSGLIREESLHGKLDALRRFQHWELLRIGACDTFGLMDFKSVTLQLSLLADGVTQTALYVVAEELHVSTDEFCVLAFGKLGGEELNYSSDIDLVFVCRDNAAKYWGLGQKLIRALMDTTAEGFLYRVDMRLRPWGKSGALVCTVDSYLEYLRSSGQLWEKQALLKARPIAGTLSLGLELLKRVEPFVFETSEEDARLNVRSMKNKIEAELAKKGRLFGDVKSGRGSIRDIEFLTQFLQLKYGRSQRAVRSANTLDGLIRLADFDCILPGEYRRLTAAYVLFRTIEHSLQLLHYEQEHSLPTDERELAFLAGRLDFPSATAFLEAYQQHRDDVRRIYERYIEVVEVEPEVDQAASKLPPHAELMEPSYAKVFLPEQIERHAVLLSRLSPDNPIEIDIVPTLGDRVQLTVCGFDQKGDLSMMCGLLFAYGFNIVLANVFTAEQVREADLMTSGSSKRRATNQDARRFVNVFVLKPTLFNPQPGQPAEEVWPRYQAELADVLRLAAGGQMREAQGRVASRVASVMRGLTTSSTAALPPINIDINNEQSERYTVLHISAEDTPGFLYELTNALSLVGFDIQRVIAASLGSRAFDTIYILDPHGERVTKSAEQARLRAAIAFVKHFTHLLPRSPNPEAALLHFGRFVERLFDQPDWASQLASLDHSDVLDALARLLGFSDFLWEDFLRLQYDNLIPVLRDVSGLEVRKSRAELVEELSPLLVNSKGALNPNMEARSIINAFKDREMFRVDMRHIIGHCPEFNDFSSELSDVAETVVAAMFEHCFAQLSAKHGVPLVDGDADSRPVRVTVLALGKAGGRELGFASDIELMFVYEQAGRTSGPDVIGAAEFFVRLVEDFANSIEARRQGIFQIDLRLRPYGNAGSLAVSLDAFESYFGPTGPAWPYERQALVKLRPIAGDEQLGQRVSELRDRFVYTGQRFDLAAMRAMRERQLRQLVERDSLNAKLSAGGLVDCEYLVQGLQITFGLEHPELRTPNTCRAIDALYAAQLLSEDEHQALLRAYGLLRRVIDALRMVRGDARDLTLPSPESQEFRSLALRLGYGSNWQSFQSDVDATTSSVLALSRVLSERVWA